MDDFEPCRDARFGTERSSKVAGKDQADAWQDHTARSRPPLHNHSPLPNWYAVKHDPFGSFESISRPIHRTAFPKPLSDLLSMPSSSPGWTEPNFRKQEEMK